MNVPFVGFSAPVDGAKGTFNVIKLGLVYAKTLKPGLEVYLLDEKAKTIFGRAEVLSVATGELKQLCLLHGTDNYLTKGDVFESDATDAGEKVFACIQKIFGHHIATETKRSTVIHLRRIANHDPKLERSVGFREA